MTSARILALVTGALSAVFITVMVPALGGAQGSSLSGLDFYSVGPTALPYFAGGMILLFSVMMLITDTPNADVVSDPDEQNGFGLGLLLIALLIGYTVALTWIGFLAASVLFMLAVFLVYGARNWLLIGALSLGMPLLVDQILRKLFLIPLPSGQFF
jgi:hypothetical protein